LLDHPHRRSLHMNTNVEISVARESAQSTSYYTMFVHENHEPWSLLSSGRYVDRLIRLAPDGPWRFAERKLVP